MTRSKRLFREAALERLSSPEQLDQQLRVTSARGWIAVIAIWALLAAVIAWSVLGEVHTREEGHGIIVTGGGLQVVVAEGSGRLNEILVGVDDTVAEDQVVARIDKHEIEAELLELRSQLQELESQKKEHLQFDRREEEAQANLEKADIDRLEQTKVFSTQRVVRLEARREIVQGLVDGGNMTEIDLHEIDEKIEDAQMEHRKAELEIEQIKAQNREASIRREREQMKREFQIRELKGTIAVLDHRRDRESQVVSKTAGIVVEIRAAEQTAVNVGDPILLIQPAESTSQQLEAILYVSAATGKRIENGDEVHIAPSTVKREEYGSMQGIVRFVSDVPTSESAMMAVLNDKQMVEKFTQQIGLPLMARVELITDDDTTSGYRWTSSDGPPVKVSAGTLCSGTVTVEKQRPISLVIPTVKKKLNLD
ncbi:MAG: NHLP bacteriocin system secretion protein [Planctomycetota bacterium]|jgi:HlyD family secretion protein